MTVEPRQSEIRTPGAALVTQESGASLTSVRGLRSGSGLSREKFARLTGFSVRALASWESGAQKPGEQARLRLVEMKRLLTALATVVRSTAIADWLDTPNPAFDGLKPIEVVERGQIDRLWRMIFQLESGVPS